MRDLRRRARSRLESRYAPKGIKAQTNSANWIDESVMTRTRGLSTQMLILSSVETKGRTVALSADGIKRFR